MVGRGWGPKCEEVKVGKGDGLGCDGVKGRGV